MVQDMDGDGAREYDEEVEDEEAYERFRSGLGRYGAGAGSGAGTAGVGSVYGRYEAMRIWEEFEGDG